MLKGWFVSMMKLQSALVGTFSHAADAAPYTEQLLMADESSITTSGSI
jgi:hypothetical protein